ncbi:unnamed protein product [Psylliodes chrysocephalus]|uniref:C2H2-type domain-containing protein n=1 Tax=Psylliodes chrysocephalus TaxID=3402493 RepID=A0A9P0DBG5_9CUCU|nr:unnamed protein product [Psylliodes chrysocephala]
MKCSYCDKNIIDINKFVYHLEYAHSMKHKYECPTCSRCFTRRDCFKRHFLSHDKDSLSENIPQFANDIFVPGPSIDSCNIANEEYNESSFHAEAKREEFLTNLQKAVLKFMTKLNMDLSIHRSFIQKVIEFVKEFLSSGFLTILKDFLFSPERSVNRSHLDVAKDLLDHIVTCFNFIDSQDVSKKNNITSLVLKQRTCTFIPVSQTLKQFMAIPGVLESIQKYQNESYVSKFYEPQGALYKNILNGSLWEEILQSTQGSTHIPLIIYYDDLETSNPLGSHAGVYKVGAVYFSIASIPPSYMSRLENIFITLIFHSQERIEFGNKAIFNCLLEDLKQLESDGIIVTNDKQTIKLYFDVVLIMDDNVGLNSILGFVESFSANYFCRFCITQKAVTQRQTQLDTQNERWKRKYENHVKNKEYGIKEFCIWNELKYFHVYHNHSVNFMHDFLEGIHRYDMTLTIKYLIQEHLFSLETLNSRLKYFNYEYSEQNHPPPVKKEQLEKGMIVFSASEMACFVKNFRYFVGDLVPFNNQAWLVYLDLLEITEILSGSEISLSDIQCLEMVTSKYLNNLLHLYPHVTLKPKHHFLLHYPEILRKTGPVSKISSVRFEAKHRELKKIANSVQTRKNIPLTLAIKCQMQFAGRCISESGFEDRIYLSKPIFDSPSFETYQFENDFNCDSYKDNFYQVKWYEKNGVRYSLLDVISYKTGEESQYCTIKNIFIDHKSIKICHLICENLNTKELNIHYRSHIVEPANKYICLKLDAVHGRPTVIHHLNNFNLVPFSKSL